MSLIEEARTVRQRVAARLRELEPLVREYEELKQVAAELGIEGDEPAGAEQAMGTPASSGSPRGRRSPRGQSAVTVGPETTDAGLLDRVLAAVNADPGHTVADYAHALELSPTALYRPVRELTTAGAIVKRARQLFPA